MVTFQNISNVVMEDKSDDSNISMLVNEEEQENIPAAISIQTATTSNAQKLKKKGVLKREWTNIKEYSSWLQEVKR
jgi:hypothetical protein